MSYDLVRGARGQVIIGIARLLSSEPWSFAQPSLLGAMSQRLYLISYHAGPPVSGFVVDMTLG